MINMYSNNYGISDAALKSIQDNYDRKKRAEEAQIQSKETLDVIKESQLRTEKILKDIFATGEEATNIQNEILKIMANNGISKNTYKEKGLEFLMQGFFTAVQIYFSNKGIKI